MNRTRGNWWPLALVCAPLLACALAAGVASAQTGAPPVAKAPQAAPSVPAPPAHYLPSRAPRRAGEYYKSVWGIEGLSVKLAESGELVRFAWRVLDPDKARALSDKKSEPSLEDPEAGVSLVVPAMANIGQLRQVQPPEAGRSYWMAFSNRGRPVKHGHHVNIVIGSFRANGIVVE